ncbi:hypothetical protein HOH45_03020 [bacterium]|nr:hypothetical protein [bacterium]
MSKIKRNYDEEPFFKIKGVGFDRLYLSTSESINLENFYEDEKAGFCVSREINCRFFERGFDFK